MSIGIKLNNTSKKLLVWSALFVGIVVSSGLVGQAFAQTSEQVRSAEERIITIFDRGSERTIITKAPTLKKALEAADISVSVGHDLVEPALDTELIAAKYNVNIYRARPVTVVDGVVRQRVTTAEQTPERIAQAADIKLYKEDVVDISAPQDLNRDGVGVVMTINRATSLNFTLYGKNTEVRTRATTVEGFLKEKKIKLGENDRLSADLSTNITKGMNLELWREGKQTITEEEDVDFQIEKIQDANREVGYREVKEVGEKGRRTVTYEVEVKNNQEVSRKEIASVTIKESKKQVEIVGSKPSFSGDFQAALAKLRSCEGGYNSWNPAGPYYGAYQFDQRTWNGVTDAPYGSATPAQQDEAAYKLYLSRGWQPWPVCGANLPDIYR